MFSRAATATLTNVARRHATVGVAKKGSKLSSPARAMSDVSAAAPKQTVDIPPPPPAGKHWRTYGHRRCHGRHGPRVAGKALAFGLVGYGGFWYGSRYGAVKESNAKCPRANEQSNQVEPGSSQA